MHMDTTTLSIRKMGYRSRENASEGRNPELGPLSSAVG